MRVLLLLLASVLAGCSALPQSPFQEPAGPVEKNLPLPPPRPGVAMVEARELSDQGEWSRALEILRGAHARYPESRELEQLLERMESRWRQEKRRLEDRMLVLDVTALLARLPLLEQLARGEPDNPALESRRRFWQSYLRNKLDDLTACGLVEQDLWLARRCLELANRIEPMAENRARLKQVIQALEHRKRSQRVQQRQRLKKARERELEQLLGQARADLRIGALTSAMLKLEQARQLAPDDPRVAALHSGVQTALDLRLESLVKLGDRLYRDENIGPAVAVWEAVLKLDPKREGVVEKIDRARRVYEKLERIRSRGVSPGP